MKGRKPLLCHTENIFIVTKVTRRDNMLMMLMMNRTATMIVYFFFYYIGDCVGKDEPVNVFLSYSYNRLSTTRFINVLFTKSF